VTYDFKTLNDKEFEALVADLLSEKLSQRVERFRSGKDKGVDGRFFATPKREVVIQCKHWARSTVSALIKYLVKVEKPKIDRLTPARYILATSLELSRDNKQAIADALSPWIAIPSDVYGNEDLNDLLARFPQVETRHYKLWLSSTNVLRAILNAAILGRSDFTLTELQEDAIRYVPTANHEVAQSKLEKLHVVLITGEPGIGKTTLAGQLCLEYVVDHEFQLCVIASSIEEAEAIFEPGKKQIFYFDDFLGRNYLAVLNRHEDSHIVGFIKRITRDKTKRFVLTSRTTVLNQGKQLSDLFRIHNVERSEYEIRVGSLTELDKARILYNHIWFSQLTQSYIDEILAKRRYRGVIEHANFNPRLISFITDVGKLANIQARAYWPYIEETLSNPADVWEHVYENQLDDYGRALLLLAVYNGGEISEIDMQSAYESFLTLAVASTYTGVADFARSCARLVGAVLNRTLTGGRPVKYSLFNPSVADYVLRRTIANVPVLRAVLQVLGTESSLLNLRSLIASDLISEKHAKILLAQLAQDALPRALAENRFDYGAILADLSLEFNGADKSTAAAAATFVNTVDLQAGQLARWDKLASATDACLVQGSITPGRALELVKTSSEASLTHTDLVALCAMRSHIDGNIGQEVEEILRPLIVEYWMDNIEDDIRKNGVLAGLYDEHEIIDGERLVREAVQQVLDDYALHFDDYAVEAIAGCVDVASEIESNREQAEGEDYESERSGQWQAVDAIDDLFNIDGPMGGRSAK
jgi:hypothetical protein